MDNNMGHHKMRKFLRPKNEHPEIITSPDVTLQYMVFTILHSLASRSIFVLLRGIKANNRILQERLAKKFNDFLTQVEIFFTDIYNGILFDGGILLNNIFVNT
jgi:hypothetical protein